MFILDISEICAKSQYELLDEDDKMMLAHIQAKAMAKQREKYLSKHPYSIYEGKDGRVSTYLPMGDGKRRKVVKKTQKEVEDIVIGFWKDKENTPTIRCLFEKWNNERLLDEQISRRSYDRYNQVFKRHFQEVDGKKIDGVTVESVIGFVKSEKRDKHLNKKAFNLLKTTVIGIIETADDAGKLPFDYLRLHLELQKTIKKMKFPHVYYDDEDQVFSQDEYDRITTYLKENPDPKNTALLLMFVTGMRVGELVALKHSAILENSIRICRSETRYQKEDGSGYIYEVQEHPKTKSGFREIVLPKQYSFLLSKLRVLNPFGEWLFVNDKGERLTVNSMSRRLDTVCRKLGINPKSPHKARKTVGTMYFDAKLDNKTILDQMGWSSEAVGETHYHMNRKSNEQKISMVSAVFEN